MVALRGKRRRRSGFERRPVDAATHFVLRAAGEDDPWGTGDFGNRGPSGERLILASNRCARDVTNWSLRMRGNVRSRPAGGGPWNKRLSTWTTPGVRDPTPCDPAVTDAVSAAASGDSIEVFPCLPRGRVCHFKGSHRDRGERTLAHSRGIRLRHVDGRLRAAVGEVLEEARGI